MSQSGGLTTPRKVRRHFPDWLANGINWWVIGFLCGWAATQGVQDVMDPTDDTRLDQAVRHGVRVLKQGLAPEVRGER